MSTLNVNAFGSYLTAVKAAEPPHHPAGAPDREDVAKRLLGQLNAADNHSVATTALAGELRLSESDLAAALAYLHDAGMITSDGDAVALSDFGQDAVGYVTTPYSPAA